MQAARQNTQRYQAAAGQFQAAVQAANGRIAQLAAKQADAGSQAEAHQPRNVSEEAVLESVDVVERNVEEDRRSQPAGAISCALCAPSSLPTDDGNDCRSRHCRSAVARLDVGPQRHPPGKRRPTRSSIGPGWNHHTGHCGRFEPEGDG